MVFILGFVLVFSNNFKEPEPTMMLEVALLCKEEESRDLQPVSYKDVTDIHQN